MARSWDALALIALILFTGGLSTLQAQPPAPTPNHVLELDGDGDYVELPANLLAGLDEVTVEGWVNWASFQKGSRFFDFGGGSFQINVQNRQTTSTLWLESPDGNNTYNAVTVPDLLVANEWIHVAAVRSSTGLQLVVNGVALATVPQSGTVNETQGTENLLGRSNFRTQFQDADFKGRMAEVRVWSQARTEGQIRSNLVAKLTGTEPGLVALYNFADPAQPGRDASGRGHDGKLMGNARTVLAQLPTAAQSIALESVLNLDGTRSYVELPPGIFTDLTEATIEAWVKWRSFGGQKRVFNYGDAGDDLSLGASGSDLWFVKGDANSLPAVRVSGLVVPNQWYHLAGVTGPGGMRLYLDGVLVGTNAFTGSFSSVKKPARNYLGQRVTMANADTLFDGQIDDFRVWNMARSEDEIRTDMLKTLQGNEPGLVGYWNFNDGTGNDSSAGRHHGTLQGNAKITASRRLNAQEFVLPAVIMGTVVDAASGSPVADARAFVTAQGLVVQSGRANAKGVAQLLIRGVNGPVRMWAISDGRMASGGDLALTAGARIEVELPTQEGSSANRSELVLGLVQSLKLDQPPGTRADAVDGLGALKTSNLSIVSALTTALEDPNELVRFRANRVLNQLPIPASLQPVFEKRSRSMAYLFGGLLIPFAAFHLLLFAFFPKVRSNFYFAAFAAMAAWKTVQEAGLEAASSSGSFIPAMCLSMATSLLGLRLLYSFFYERLPRLFWCFLIPGVAGGVTAFILRGSFPAFALLDPGVSHSAGKLPVFFVPVALALIIVGLVSLGLGVEMFRVAVLAIIRRRRGAWIIGGGILAVLLFPLAAALGEAFSHDFLRDFLGYTLWPYLSNMGVVVFATCASVHLAGEFAQTYRHLASAKQEIELKNRDLATATQAAEAARASADEANQAKSSFLANMSHELRTPMNAIIGYSEMLQEEAEDLDQKGFIPDLQKIHGAGKHLLALINDILDLSKIEAGKTTLFLEEFDVAKLVQEVAATVQPLVTKNSNTLVVECPAEIGTMRADVTKLRQTLFNLLSNASKFTERGTVTLRVGKEVISNQLSVIGEEVASAIPPLITDHRSLITFRVSDTGIGMTPEQMGKLFQAFSQADASTTRKFGGTGLGLAISKKFCQVMGGDITVTSERGVGTTFTATLPREVTEAAPEPISASAGLTNPQSAIRNPQFTVLVIDDDANVRDLMHRTLVKEGFHVEVAADGKTGLELARRVGPAVITLDVMMSGMDGWAVLTALKADPATADIPVIMLTIVDDKNLGFALGAVDYFTKPIDWKRLSAALRKHRRSTASQTVLIVEDDPNTREMLRRSMEKDGWTVIEAENGRAGLDCLNGEVPAIILLDLMMPETDGFEFMEQLRARPDCRDVPVIVITAKDLTPEDHQRLNGDVSRIIQKGPASTDKLLAQVREVLARQAGLPETN